MASKREQTRERLMQAALGLFAAQGYDQTSVSQIAAQAGVTEMTFFRHFPTKESPLVDDPYDPLISEAVSRQPANLDPLTRAVRGIQDAWRSIPEPAGEEVRSRLRIVAQTPSLTASLTRASATTQAAIADALTIPGTSRRDALIAAAAVMAALNAALLEWCVSDNGPLGEAIEAAMRVLEHRGG